MCVCVSVYARVCTLQRLYYIVHYDIRISGYMESRKYLLDIRSQSAQDTDLINTFWGGGGGEGALVCTYTVYTMCVSPLLCLPL